MVDPSFLNRCAYLPISLCTSDVAQGITLKILFLSRLICCNQSLPSIAGRSPHATNNNWQCEVLLCACNWNFGLPPSNLNQITCIRLDCDVCRRYFDMTLRHFWDNGDCSPCVQLHRDHFAAQGYIHIDVFAPGYTISYQHPLNKHQTTAMCGPLLARHHHSHGPHCFYLNFCFARHIRAI